MSRTIEMLAAMLLSLMLCLGLAADAAAQQPTTRGWAVGMDFGGTAAAFGNRPHDTGGVVGARVGYGLNKALMLYLGIYEVDIDAPELFAFDKATFGHYDLGVRLHLAGASRHWVPYGDLAFTSSPVNDVLKNGERIASNFDGRAISLGGGLSVYLSETWALDVNVKWGTGELKGIPVDGTTTGVLDRLDVDAASARFTVGFSWWP